MVIERGERVIAFVAFRDGLTASEQELRDFARSRLADYKVPERVFFLPVLPKGPTGRLQRRALKDLALALSENARCSSCRLRASKAVPGGAAGSARTSQPFLAAYLRSEFEVVSRDWGEDYTANRCKFL